MTKKIPTIETERLRLRPAGNEDLDTWAKQIFADPMVTRYLGPSKLEPHRRAERMLEYCNRLWNECNYGIWVVADKLQGTFLGTCGLGYLIETDETEIDYAFAQDHWGKGFATEAVKASLRFGFESAKIDRIIGLAVPENIGSRRVLEHNHFKYVKDAHYFGFAVVYYEIHRRHYQPGSELYQLHTE